MNNEDENIKKILFISEIESEINRLDCQLKRILEYSYNKQNEIHPTHDADFYMVLLRRLYRRVEKELHDSRVANLKGKYDIHKKIKIRDHFEHEINYETFPYTISGVKCSCGIVINGSNDHIISGNEKWFLNEDHKKFKALVSEFIKLYPFAPKNIQKEQLLCTIIKKIKNKICRNKNKYSN